jgi:signal peptidase I
MAFRGLKKLYVVKEGDPRFYEFWKHFTGYSVVFTYVAGIFPQVVRDYNNPGGDAGGPALVILVLLCTLFPALHYLILSRDQARLATGVYTDEEVAQRKTLKKDKVKQKALRKSLKKERNPLQNLWYEWVEPVLGAILWVLVINHLFFQLYQIPSESMVPTFLTKDRVVALKSQYGPTIPLTNYRLPSMTDPKVGQIVTFITPEMSNPDSDLRYKNVFTRVFQPFIYIITLTRVDIDAYDNGEPKARQLVKRVVGVPGEKVSLLNDRVYKKIPGGEWQAMAELPGQEEWGRPDLFYNENPRMEYQRITPPLRAVLDRAVSRVEEVEAAELALELASEKARFLQLLRGRGVTEASAAAEQFLAAARRSNEEYKSQLTYYLRYMSWINTLEMTEADARQLISRYEDLLGQYERAAFYGAVRDLAAALEEEIRRPGSLDSGISTQVAEDPSGSPYARFMAKANGLMKLSRLRLYNVLLSSPVRDLSGYWGQLWETLGEKDIPGLGAFSDLCLFTDGIERPAMGGGEPDYYNYFEAMQFPEYPAEKDRFLASNEYFLMGDNRYNSVDSRLGWDEQIIYLDPRDQGVFAESVSVSWDGHPIPRENIQGRVRAILFPFSRLRLF